MNIIVHYPDTKDNTKELENRVAAVHAKAVINYVNALNSTYDKKTALLDELLKVGATGRG